MSDITLGLDDSRETTRAIRALESAVEELREQLDRERQRADTAEGSGFKLTHYPAERELAGVEVELIDARLKPPGFVASSARSARTRDARLAPVAQASPPHLAGKEQLNERTE